jgi:phosphoribosylanthranilate isomerase
MTTLVKICGLRDAGHVAAAVAAGANAIGFVFADSVRRVTPQAALAAAVDIPPAVRRVAVMRHPSNDEWTEVLEVFSPDVLQTDAEDLVALNVPDSVSLWPVVREGGAVLKNYSHAEFVYEGPNSGQGETVDWSQAANIAKRGRMILAGGLSPANIAAAIQTVKPFGVDVSSGVESRPGEKSPDLIRQFIRAVRTAESSL